MYVLSSLRILYYSGSYPEKCVIGWNFNVTFKFPLSSCSRITAEIN